MPDLVVSPGLVDTHVHINEPGRTEWEGFDTATRAAAAGGVTTLVDMPLNSVPATTTVAALRAKVDAARAQCHVDVGFWGGVVPGNAGELEGLVDAGVRGFKCFLVPSGVDEFPAVDEDDLRQALPILARRSVPLLVHAEVALSDSHAAQAAIRSPQYACATSRRVPPAMELDAIRLMIRLAEEFQTRVHIVHVSSAEAVEAIAGAKAALGADHRRDLPALSDLRRRTRFPTARPQFKCAPPIREAAHRERCGTGWRAARSIWSSTDHSPAPPALKTPGDFVQRLGRHRVAGAVAARDLDEPQASARVSALSSQSRAEMRQPAVSDSRAG